MMSDKFKNVSVEEDTQVFVSAECKLGELEVLYQKWLWDGIFAESVIFESCDVEHLNDKQLVALFKDSSLVENVEKHTIARTPKGYTFFNFNFKVKD